MAYAVIWNEDDGPDYTGRLELTDRTIRLIGTGEGSPEVARELRYSELASFFLERCAPARNVWEPALVLRTTAGERIAIGSLEGLGSLHEIAGTVADALARVAA